VFLGFFEVDCSYGSFSLFLGSLGLFGVDCGFNGVVSGFFVVVSSFLDGNLGLSFLG